ncbi:MAG: hypothetical protein JXB00_09465 [Bacteroidales bacterium]|nr:hypothetical protein [Bacteroidales bacterium]
MGSKRRTEYLPISKHPEAREYHEKFDKLRLNSRILNAGGQKISFDSIVAWDRTSILSLLAELQGNIDGQYVKEKTYYTARLPLIQAQIAEIEQKFKDFQQQRINEGYKKPEKMPEKMFIDLLRLQASEDVTTEEIEFLQEKLNEFEELLIKEKSENILACGPKGSGRLQGGFLVEIDGQQVTSLKGVLVISEKTSPYYGLSVFDYREFVAKPWTTERKRKMSDLQKKRELQLKEQGYSNIQLKNLLGHKIDKSILPPFPKGCKNYFEESKIKRAEKSTV